MASQVVTYTLDDQTSVSFEIEQPAGFGPAGTDTVAGRVRDAVEPAVRAAKDVLDSVRDACPDEVVVKFGVKASGTMSWLVAKASAEGNFEITLTWKSAPPDGAGDAATAS